MAGADHGAATTRSRSLKPLSVAGSRVPTSGTKRSARPSRGERKCLFSRLLINPEKPDLSEKSAPPALKSIWQSRRHIVCETTRDIAPSDEENRDVDLGDGSAPLRYASTERAWRVKGGAWQREPTGRGVYVAVLRYLASIDGRGRHRFYSEAVNRTGTPMFSDTENDPKKWWRIEPGIDKFVKVHHSNKYMEQLIAQACQQCRPSTGAAIRFGDDIEVLLDL